MGYAVVHLVMALYYKLEGHEFVSRWGHSDYFNELIFPAAL